mgnify:CR=1 FL=1
MLTKIILEGEFAKVAKKKVWMLDCSSPAEAIQLISVNTGGAIRRWIREHLKDYKICEVECTYEDGRSEQLDTETFQMERQCKTIRFLPIFAGAGGNNGVLQTIVGVVLIVVGAILAYPSGGSSTTMMQFGWSMIGAGVGMALSGICTMLMSTSKDDDDDSSSNYYFNGAQNTTNQGAPVPLVFGRCRVGSAVISSGIDITQK